MKQFHIFFPLEVILSDFPEEPRYVVTEPSAAPFADNTERVGVPVIRFSDASSTSHRTVMEALVRYSRDAPAIISRKWQQATEALSHARSNEAIELAGLAFDVLHQIVEKIGGLSSSTPLLKRYPLSKRFALSLMRFPSTFESEESLTIEVRRTRCEMFFPCCNGVS